MARDLRRRHGFAGQHFIVLPRPDLLAAARHPLLQSLHVSDAGYFPNARGHWVERLNGTPTTLAILCLRGRGSVATGSVNRPVEAGDFAWLPADQSHAYGAAKDDPWTIAWAHFDGAEVPAWRELIFGSSSDPIVTLHRDRLHEIALDRVYAALELDYSLRSQIAAAAALRHALSMIAQRTVAPGAACSAEDRVRASVATLRKQWREAHRLGELATAAGLSVTHYSALFRRQTGFSPIDFLIRLRVREACALLDTTRLTIAEVAERVGYEDPFYFARTFRGVMGRSPRDYRSITKG